MISRCLLPFVDLYSRDVNAARKAFTKLPKVCPHKDCSPGATCKGVCEAWVTNRPEPVAKQPNRTA